MLYKGESRIYSSKHGLQEIVYRSKVFWSFSGKSRFIKAIRSEDRSIKRSDAEQALRSIDSYSLHKQLKRPKLHRRIYSKGINYLFQIDLIDMSKFEDENDGYRLLKSANLTFKFVFT